MTSNEKYPAFDAADYIADADDAVLLLEAALEDSATEPDVLIEELAKDEATRPPTPYC